MFPRYAVGKYYNKSKYSAEYYKNAKESLRNVFFTSDKFVDEIINVANVVAFPINNTTVHPRFEEIQSLSEEIVSMCYDGGNVGLLYIKSGGPRNANEINLLKQIPGVEGNTTVYSLYCNEKKVVSTPMCYGIDGVETRYCTPLRKKVAQLVCRVLEARWLPKTAWSAIVLPCRESQFKNPIVMGKNMFEYYKAFKDDFNTPNGFNYKDPPFCNIRGLEREFPKIVNRNSVKFCQISSKGTMGTGLQELAKESTNKDSLELRDFVDEKPSEDNSFKFSSVRSADNMNSIINEVKSRRDATFRGMFMSVNSRKSPEDVLELVTNDCERLKLGKRYIVDSCDSTKNKKNKWATEFLVGDKLVYSNEYWRFEFWSDLDKDVKINAFPIDSIQAHPDYSVIKDICSEITRELIHCCETYEIGKLWYLSPVITRDVAKSIKELDDDIDYTRFELYCNDSYKGFVQPCFCYDGKEHTKLEKNLAKLLYIITSVPWLNLELWGNLVLPCSGVAVKNFDGDPAIVSDDILAKLKYCVNSLI